MSSGFKHVSSSLSAGGSAKCYSGNLDVPISTTNVQILLDEPANQTAVTEIFQELLQGNSTIAASKTGGSTQIKATFAIDITICTPANTTVDSSALTLQVLTHGTGSDKTYWDIAPGYSYVDAAAKAGFATLAYNRLGVGASDHPDPIQTVQTTGDVEILQGLIEAVEAGAITLRPPRHIIGVGHSYGSIVQLAHNAKYHNATAATVLTGFVNNLVNLAGTALANNPAIAAINQPERFQNLPNGYVVHDTPISVQLPFFRSPFFDQKIFDNQYNAKNTYALGQQFTLAGIYAPAPAYEGPVHIVAGMNDFPFCGGDCTSPRDQTVASISALYPSAAQGSTGYIVPQAGHYINAHYGAQDQFKEINGFLTSHGFGQATA